MCICHRFSNSGAQDGARIAELRELGYIIDNEMERSPDGEIHSFYILRAEPGETPALFRDLPTDKQQRYRDPEEEGWA